jgi:hypothetical protein
MAYGEYVYCVNLPADFPLGPGNDFDPDYPEDSDFETPLPIPAKYIKLIRVQRDY